MTLSPTSMFRLQFPNSQEIEALRKASISQSFSYKSVGASANASWPKLYFKDQKRECIGHGSECFEKAKQAIKSWKLFDLKGVHLFPPPVEPRAGQISLMVFNLCGLKILNFCKVAYEIDSENAELARFGFAYGTLDCHSESGEERFLLEWNKKTDQVFYEISAFSRPHHWWGYCGLPLIRLLQKLAASSSVRVIRACANGARY